MALLPLPLALALTASPVQASTADFEVVQLSESFYCEGASYGDINGDGALDIVSGPFWYEGPEWQTAHEIYEPKLHDPLGYSDNFFVFLLDMNGDQRVDIFRIGFPGQDATWHENPGATRGHWKTHQVFDHVDNESPTLIDITGDGRPELVCNSAGAFGYAEGNWQSPADPWTFHPISENLKKGRFTHGLGVGDINGDGRPDVLEAQGWWEHPAQRQAWQTWVHHPFPFSTRGGGAQMLVHDFDGDGDADVASSLWAHGFGLSWFEQVRAADGSIDFKEHLILDRGREQNPYGVRFSALHALALADMDGDGLQDIVTGKRHWSHGPDGDPKPGGPSVLYWLRTERTEQGVRFVPHLVDENMGVGTQVVVGDVNGDGRPDVIVGNKAGTRVALQNPAGASITPPPLYLAQAAPQSPNDRVGMPALHASGRELNLGFETGDLTDWTVEGEAFQGQPVQGDAPSNRGREPSEHVGHFWIGAYEVHGDGPVGSMFSESFEVRAPWATCLIGGGENRESTFLQIENEAGDVLLTVTGGNSETMKTALMDLRSFQGQRVRLRLVDKHTGGWGHLNFDDFLFHASKPEIPASQKALQRDEVLAAGLSPQEGARAMTVPPGFHVDLIAAEPDLHQPIAFTFDHKGRLWVAEAHSYPKRLEGDTGSDTILVFEDLDANGSFETRTVFMDSFNLVSGLEVGHGGVWVGAAPYLYFVADRDDDLVPDGAPEVVLDGWAYEDTHETLNAFTWGPDGWLYGCHGVFTHSNVGPPGTPENERQPINAGVWRYHPTAKQFEVFAWGTSNPWGLDFDDRGQAFVTACVIPHLFHMIQGGRYHRQAGNHFHAHAFSEIVTAADHRHYLGSTPHAGNNRSASAGGGHAHCGAMVYLGDAFPEQYRGRLFMNNIHGNRMNNDSLEQVGSGFVAHHEEDFLLANDAWYRGINMKYGPDGQVYFIDWYDERACHSQEPEVWDRTNGRLYRVRYGEQKPVAVDLSKASTPELCEMQLSANDWFVRQARLELAKRKPAQALQPLVTQLQTQEDAPRRLRALWALHACGLASPELLLPLLEDREPYIVAWSVQLLTESGAPSDTVRAALVELAGRTQSPVVRLYLASSMQRMGGDFPMAQALLAHGEDGDDANLPTLLWYGVEPLVAQDPERAIALAKDAQIESIQRFLVRRAAAEGATRDPLVAELAQARDLAWRDLLLEELDLALRDQRNVPMSQAWPAVYQRLAQDDSADARDRALWIAVAFQDANVAPALAALVEDLEQNGDRRLRALEALATIDSPQVLPILLQAIDDEGLRGSAIRSLAAFDDASIPRILLSKYPEFDAQAQADVLATLSGRETSALALLSALESGVVAKEALSAFVLRQMSALQSDQVDDALEATWGLFRETDEDKLALIAEFQTRFESENAAWVRPSHGRAVYDNTCGKCHVLFGAGGEVGPDLTGSNRKNLEYLATNIIDPNAVIGRDYQATVVRTKGGQVLTGLLKNESESSITLLSETSRSVIAKQDIEDRYLSKLSTMPEGQAATLSPAELRDLVAYLRGDEQVAQVTASVAEVSLFNGADLAGWEGDTNLWSVEGSEIVGHSKTDLARNAFLVYESEFDDFRLSFEVKLAGNFGNSGVQFRSRQIADGDVTGYQADIGAGWWGKLYEEHGRGVLVDTSRASLVRENGWNEYVIEVKQSRVRTWLNGELCVDLEDPDGAQSGRIALQLHSGPPTQVRFRNFKLEPAGE